MRRTAEGGQAYFRIWTISAVPLMDVQEARIFTGGINKKLLEDNGLPNIRWHDLRSTFCTILLKNNFNPKAVSQLMGHAKEIITIDVYGDTAEIIEDCLDDLQPFIDEVVPKKENESRADFSEDDYIDNISEFLG